jgi:hypothetical protein
MDCGFTLAHYRETLAAYRKAGYVVMSFDAFLENSLPHKVLILRHDIDMSLEPALRVARIDAEMGCSATFFLRLHSKYYSLLTLDSYRAVKAIADMGHELGLHFEPGFSHAVDEDPIEFADRQRTIIEAILGKPILGISTHEPVRSNNAQIIDELCKHWKLKYHAYEDRFTEQMKQWVQI